HQEKTPLVLQQLQPVADTQQIGGLNIRREKGPIVREEARVEHVAPRQLVPAPPHQKGPCPPPPGGGRKCPVLGRRTLATLVSIARSVRILRWPIGENRVLVILKDRCCVLWFEGNARIVDLIK